MIRINLVPGRKKQGLARAAQDETRGAAYLGVMALGWVCVAGAAYWKLDVTQEETQAFRRESEKNRAKTEEIRKLIDEDALEARRKRVQDVRNAIESVQGQRHTPVFMMYELAQVLSTGKMPDINEEMQRRREATDPLSRLNPSWDASSVWLTRLQVVGGRTLKLAGTARDPADLDEFLKRLRSSVRFGRVTHPKYDAGQSRSGASRGGARTYKFTFDADVAFWD